MKRIVMIFTALLMAGAGLHAQEILTRFSTDRISCKYTYSIDVPITLTYEGDALVQGECYHLAGNGLEIICDGVTRWTVDAEAREVYIENADEVENILKEFLTYSKDIKMSGNTLTGTLVDPDDETNIKFALKEIVYLPADSDLAPFTLDVESLDDTYLVTDMRL
jgi:hypothetical protein